MLVSDIHGLEGPSFQRAGMVVSAEATLHLEEEDVVSLSLCRSSNHVSSYRGNVITGERLICISIQQTSLAWIVGNHHRGIKQSMSERRTGSIVHRVEQQHLGTRCSPVAPSPTTKTFT